MIEESPVFTSENKIKMKLNDMKKDIFYPVIYKNKKYFIVTPKEGVIDIYKVK